MTQILLSQKKRRPISANYFLTESIVILSILQMFLTAAVSSLKFFQVHVEIALLAALLFACSTIKYDRWQVFLLFTFLSVTVLSFFTVDLSFFMVTTKQTGMAVLALLYFSKGGYKSRLILPTFIVTLSLLVINKFAPGYLDLFIELSSKKTFNQSRFGGLFLNTHFNAYFMATALIYYSYKKNLYGFGLVALSMTRSKFVLVSYIGSHIAKLHFIRHLAKSRLIICITLVFSVFLFINYAQFLIKFFDSRPFGLTLNSLSVMLMQMSDPAYYKIFLNPIPGGNLDVSLDALGIYPGHSGYPEVGYFGMVGQCGIFLAVMYLFMLLRHALYYRAFILISAFHYPFIFSPLIIYMILVYSREIKSTKV
jgi:hypothetical protein